MPGSAGPSFEETQAKRKAEKELMKKCQDKYLARYQAFMEAKHGGGDKGGGESSKGTPSGGFMMGGGGMGPGSGGSMGPWVVGPTGGGGGMMGGGGKMGGGMGPGGLGAGMGGRLPSGIGGGMGMGGGMGGGGMQGGNQRVPGSKGHGSDGTAGMDTSTLDPYDPCREVFPELWGEYSEDPTPPMPTTTPGKGVTDDGDDDERTTTGKPGWDSGDGTTVTLSTTTKSWQKATTIPPDGTIGKMLTHWGRDKMAAISRQHIQMQFIEWKCLNFDWNFTEVFS